jgi:Zn-dependent M28 family amino/carboxypeptidase
LDDILRDVLMIQGRRLVPDPFPAEGFYFRMDHFEFADVGVPAISPSMGVDVIGKPPGFGKQQVDQYLARDYHQPSDEVRPDWDYGGAVQDAQMSLLLGIRVAEADAWPQWKSGAEFKARRDTMLARKNGS